MAVVSDDAVSTADPSGENSAHITGRLCPLNVCLHSPVEQSQSFAVQSPDAVRTRDASGENETDHVEKLCPTSVCVHFPVAPSQILAVWSWEAVTILGTPLRIRVTTE